ncbi:NLR family CARD domain-containing protein 3-like isoform X3 [Siniperca chuatsi]|nr:NLR family CARD domain-containing protein 3-like isoform X3 [Siniperca chuatsi]
METDHLKGEVDFSKGLDIRHKLTEDLKKTILSQHEETLKRHETDTELYEIKAGKDEKDKAQAYDALFHNREVQTVLMKGVADVGKTFQTRMFMVDWANGKSNKKIDLIVSFDFSELNSRRNEVQSMKDLLCHSLNHNKHRKACKYDEWKVAIILDGLEKCKLPLDFEKNKDLTDMDEAASMDVLLTNLIKKKLLPSALLWIISQPSGVDKIPSEYIQKETECRETVKRRQKLISTLRKRFLEESTQDEDINHPNQKNTEHIIKENRSGEVSAEEKNARAVVKSVPRVNAISDIFKDTEGQTIRTVLTTGEAGIGKSFHVQKFIKEWAKNYKKSSFNIWFWKAKADENIIFPLNISKLNSTKEKNVSLVGLLNHFFKETNTFVISNFEQFKVLFVLDGLDAYQGCLDTKDTLTDVREPASVDVLLTNLIRGNLLPSARLWITSRWKLLDTWVDRTTEIRCKPDVASQQKLKSQLKEQFTHVSEGIDMQKTSALLNEIYTDLYIIEGERGEVNVQHEARQVQDAKFKPVRQETSIKYHDIFKPAPGENNPIRTVLTIGVAGIGKTFASKKYMLDWAEGTANGDIFYIFPLSFRELNLKKAQEHSLEDLINDFCPGMKTSEINDYDKYRILIVLDGLDECRLDLDFNEVNYWSDVRKPTSVNVLLTSLIQGKLLSEAQIWITSRPAASNHIPPDKVDRVTEVRGFNDEQKEEYFRKRFSDKDLAEKILSHVKKSRSLYIMCHIPVFCWITAKVLEDFVTRNQEGMMPKTLTDMYIYFLVLQCRQAIVKYGRDETGESSETDSCWETSNKETIISLGKLAFEALEEGNLLFTEENLTEYGVDITKTAVFSGLFTQIKKESCVLSHKLFCFVHLSIQEFLAAFYVFHTFNNKGENLLTRPTSTVADLPASDFYKTAVNKALDSKNGDWDLFLRFLLGLSLETNHNLLQELLKKTENNKETNKETIEYIKEKIREDNSDADKNLNLFHCLNELNDQSLVDEVKKYLHSEKLTYENFSASQWSALTFVLLTSDEKLDVFDLKKYLKSEKVLLGMLPVVKVSKTALLSWCDLHEESCRGLSSSVLSSASSNLTELDLSHNDLKDSGVQILAEGLKSIHCKLEILKLSGCQVTEKGCSFLASALNSKTALKQLDLSYNHPGTNGVAILSKIATDPNMNLKTLCLDHGGGHRLKTGLKKYGADLKLDENTASRRLVLSEGNRKVKTVKKVKEKVPRPEHKDRFKRTQVCCEEGLKGLCYWEVEWKGMVGIAVLYRTVGRKWDRNSGLGCNEMSWSLLCSRTGYTAIHGKTSKDVEVSPCQKIAVFLDWEGGTLTYFSVKSGELSLIHTFHAKFTEPLFPGFWFKKGSVNLCEID